MTFLLFFKRTYGTVLHAGIVTACWCGILFLPQRATGQEKAKVVVTLGTSTTTNVFNNALEIGDKFTDLNIQLGASRALKKNTAASMEYLYKKDWKHDHEEINATIQDLGFRLTHRFAKKHSLQSAFVYQDYGIYRAGGVNLSLLYRHTKTNTLHLNYAFQKRRFANDVQNGTNQAAKIMNTFPVDSVSTLTPYYQYEINTTGGAPNLEYKGHTLGMSYNWKDKRKPKKKISYSVLYDYRIRNYDTPFLFKGMLSTKQEKRHQLNLGVAYHASPQVKFIVKYIYFENHASSDNAFYVKGKSYRAHIFSAAVQFEPVTALKKKHRSQGDKDE